MKRWILFLTLLAAGSVLSGCDDSNPSDATSPMSTQHSEIADLLIAQVDPVLNKDVASPDDMRFLSSLTDDEIGEILAYYQKHPKLLVDEDDTDHRDELAPDLAEKAWVMEPIEFMGWGYGGWTAYSWIHTSLCGGEVSDHFFYYPNLPGGYADRGRLRLRTVHPGIWTVMQYYGRRLSSRVYSDGDVFTCVGVALHWVGVTHNAWRTGIYLYKS